MLTAFKGFYCINTEIICQYAYNKLSAFQLIIIFIITPFILFSQSYPDTTVYKKAIIKLVQNSGFMINPNITNFQQVKFSNNNFEQCVSISPVRKKNIKKKILIFWQKDTTGNWSDVSNILTDRFKFIDFDHNGILEIECIDKTGDKNHREKKYRLISLIDGNQTEMYAYHQFEYYNVSYIQSNIAPDSVFAVMHSIRIKDIDWDGKPEITDNIEIKYRKLPCCDHHFEYGIRQKKLVLHLINGKFESE